jgi:hypothetical protein
MNLKKLDKPTEEMLILISKHKRTTPDKVITDYIKSTYEGMKK